MTKLDTVRDSDEYASWVPSKDLIADMEETSVDGVYLRQGDLALVRVKREWMCRGAMSAMHKDIARGEIALLLNVFGEDKIDHLDVPDAYASSRGTKSKRSSIRWKGLGGSLLGGSSLTGERGRPVRLVPLNAARTWFLDERLPEGWKPVRKIKLRDLVRDTKLVKSSIVHVQEHWKEVHAERACLRSRNRVVNAAEAREEAGISANAVNAVVQKNDGDDHNNDDMEYHLDLLFEDIAQEMAGDLQLESELEGEENFTVDGEYRLSLSPLSPFSQETLPHLWINALLSGGPGPSTIMEYSDGTSVSSGVIFESFCETTTTHGTSSSSSHHGHISQPWSGSTTEGSKYGQS